MMDNSGSQPSDIRTAVEAHAIAHARGAADPIQAFYDEYDATSLLISAGFAFVQGEVSTLSNLVVGSLMIKQVLFNVASGIPIATSATDIVTQSITTTGGAVLSIGIGNIIEVKLVAADYGHVIDLYRDTTGLFSINNVGRGANNLNARTPGALVSYDILAAGTYVYRVKGSYNSASTSGTPTGNASILLAELK